jgi:hypothetical protein
VIEKRYARNSFSINFIPFGAGQFQNGQRRKGWAFLASESALALVSVGALTTNLAIYGFRPHRTCLPPMGGAEVSSECQIDRTDEDRSRLLTRIQVVSGAAFFAVAAWGIADAIMHFRPEVPLTTEVPSGTTGEKVKVRIAPLAFEGGAGAGVAFRF